MERPNTHAEINEFRQLALKKGALECIARGGFEGATVRTIAAAAGTSRGLIGHYYSGRDELLVESHNYLFDMVGRAVYNKVSKPGLTARERLILMPKVIFSNAVFNETNSKAFLAFWHASATVKEYGQNQEVFYNAHREQIREILETANEEGAHVRDPTLTSFAYVALLDGLWLQLSVEKKLSRKQALMACEQFVDLHLAQDAP